MNAEHEPGEFTVTQWFINGSSERVLHLVPAKPAVECAKRLSVSVGAFIGTTQRIRITDLDDSVVFEWQFGKGVVFPLPPTATLEQVNALIQEGSGSVDIGDKVWCDFCGEDFTTSTRQGGLMLGSKAACPDCAPRIESLAIKHGEQEYIRGRCPDGMSYADWTRSLRDGNNIVTINTIDL